MYRPIQDVLAFAYVLCEFALVGSFDENLIKIVAVSDARLLERNTHEQGCLDIPHLALELCKALQDGGHIVEVLLPASHVARLQQAGVEPGRRKLGPAKIQ
jgi:hypothetical protein